ncbi:MAG: DUF3179 domain-containing protein [Deinococcus sp.]|nr:DUF3179 domain-containing protein [Deinococcus sp.]
MFHRCWRFNVKHRACLVLAIVALALGATSAQFGTPPQFTALGTDLSRFEVEPSLFLSGGPPPDGIPALDAQNLHFVSSEEATFLADLEPVILFTLNGDARAYPLQIMTWHEIANDVVGGVPVAVTFCPLCNTAIAYSRRIAVDDQRRAALSEVVATARERLAALEAVLPEERPSRQLVNDAAAALVRLGFVPEAIDARSAVLQAFPSGTPEARTQALAQARTALDHASQVLSQTSEILTTFGTSGTLLFSDLVMYDRATRSLWPQIDGRAVVGTLTGAQLEEFPAQIISFADFQAAFPAGQVLSTNTGISRPYGQNPYVGYDRIDNPPFLFDGVVDGRLAPKERVVAVEIGDQAIAYPFNLVSERGVINDVFNNQPLVIFFVSGTTSALDARSIAGSRDVGATGVFDPTVAGQPLIFTKNDQGQIVDQQTGSVWSITGQALSGPLAGQALTPIMHTNIFWFAWAAFRPETVIFGVEG